MLDEKKVVSVYNRVGNGSCGYSIPELGITHRNFAPGETKKLTVEELRKLTFVEGGECLLREYLIIQDNEVIEELLGHVEPEYFYSDADIEHILNSGTLDELEDCLNFAPRGVIETMQDTAVRIQLNDMRKRKMIMEKTGKNIDRAIRANEEVAAALGEEPKAPVEKTRKASTPTKAVTEEAPARKTAAPANKYTLLN